MAADEINYRRFFDINELAALRMEEPAVFEATHRMALELAAQGMVDGLRIDHPDGLHDPAQYFCRLQEGYAQRAGLTLPTPAPGARPERPLYVVAEKIAAPHEDVPEEWAIHGTTGYRFATVVNGVLVDTAAAERFARIWRSFTGVREPFGYSPRMQARHQAHALSVRAQRAVDECCASPRRPPPRDTHSIRFAGALEISAFLPCTESTPRAPSERPQLHRPGVAEHPPSAEMPTALCSIPATHPPGDGARRPDALRARARLPSASSSSGTGPARGEDTAFYRYSADSLN